MLHALAIDPPMRQAATPLPVTEIREALTHTVAYIGFPGAIKCQSIWLSSDQVSMALQVNSVPLSETIMPGLPR